MKDLRPWINLGIVFKFLDQPYIPLLACNSLLKFQKIPPQFWPTLLWHYPKRNPREANKSFLRLSIAHTFVVDSPLLQLLPYRLHGRQLLPLFIQSCAEDTRRSSAAVPHLRRQPVLPAPDSFQMGHVLDPPRFLAPSPRKSTWPAPLLLDWSTPSFQ